MLMQHPIQKYSNIFMLKPGANHGTPGLLTFLRNFLLDMQSNILYNISVRTLVADCIPKMEVVLWQHQPF